MPSSHSSKSVLPDPHSRLAVWLTWIIREFTACVFIFSGFVKAIDPWGTLYKVNDYLAAMHLSLWPNLVIVGVFFLCGIEFLLGVFLATGCFRKGTSVLVLLFMAVMLPLTLWIAVFNPVADCGCFGDAVILTNWETFWKNIVLTACALWLVMYNRYCPCIIMPALQWLSFIATGLFIFLIEIFGYTYQPLIDFRPYKIDTSLAIESDHEEEDEPEFIFVYKKGGIEKEFSIDEIPDEEDGWEFVDRRENNQNLSNINPVIKDAKEFHIWDGDTDVTDHVISPEKNMLILTMPEMETVSISTVWKINSLYDWAAAHGIEMIAVVNGSEKDIDKWEDISMPEYPIYTADDTSIKELVRGNPAVTYVSNGTVKWKSTLRAIDSSDFITDNPVNDPMSFARDNLRILRNFSLIYLGVIILLILASMIPVVRHAVIHNSEKIAAARSARKNNIKEK